MQTFINYTYVNVTACTRRPTYAYFV